MMANKPLKAPVVNAAQFIERLKAHRSAAELKKYERFFKFSDSKPLKDDEFIGVRMGRYLSWPKSLSTCRRWKLKNCSKAGSTR